MEKINTSFLTTFSKICTDFAPDSELLYQDKELQNRHSFITNLMETISTIDLSYSNNIKFIVYFFEKINNFKISLLDLYKRFKTDKISLTDLCDYMNSFGDSAKNSCLYNDIYMAALCSFGGLRNADFKNMMFAGNSIKITDFLITPKFGVGYEDNENYFLLESDAIKTYKKLVNEYFQANEVQATNKFLNKILSAIKDGNSLCLYNGSNIRKYDKEISFLIEKNKKISSGSLGIYTIDEFYATIDKLVALASEYALSDMQKYSTNLKDYTFDYLKFGSDVLYTGRDVTVDNFDFYTAFFYMCKNVTAQNPSNDLIIFSENITYFLNDVMRIGNAITDLVRYVKENCKKFK